MLPNLNRISGEGDDLAESILTGLPPQLDALAVAGLQESARLALGRYGVRAVTFALRERSIERLRNGLTASAVAALGSGEDSRDVIVGIALHHVTAQRLGYDTTALFDEVAHRLPDGVTSQLLVMFGARSDVTLEDFGWSEVTTATGLDFVPI